MWLIRGKGGDSHLHRIELIPFEVMVRIMGKSVGGKHYFFPFM